MKRTILRGAYALLGEEFSFEKKALDVEIENGRIGRIRPAGTLSGEAVEDLSGRLLVPGLVNGHFHSHEHFQRGRIENLPLELWMHYVRTPLPVNLNPRQTYLRTLIGAIESLRTGATTVVDDLALGGAINRPNVDAVLQAYQDAGLRVLLGFAMMNRPIVDNFPFAEEEFPPEQLAQLRLLKPPPEGELLGLMKDLAKNHHPAGNRVGVLVSVSAPQRCTKEFLLAARRLADELDLPTVSHVHETRMQVVTGQLFFGKPQVEYLHEVGFLKPKTSLIHAVWLNPREIAALAETGATAQHNPWSNLMLGSGYQPVRPLLEAGVNVSLGSDGSCSTVTASMLNVLGQAAALSKIRGDDYTRWLSAKEALRAGTVSGAKALGLAKSGTIAEGMVADLVAYDLKGNIAFTPLNDPIQQLVYAERGAGIDFVMVDGAVALRDGRITTLDERKIIDEIAEEFERLSSEYARAEASVGPMRTVMERIYRRALRTSIAPDTYPARF
jgi:5-methylthioadenosine/S-adenosylhomocysteine deaminase